MRGLDWREEECILHDVMYAYPPLRGHPPNRPMPPQPPRCMRNCRIYCSLVIVCERYCALWAVTRTRRVQLYVYTGMRNARRAPRVSVRASASV